MKSRGAGVVYMSVTRRKVSRIVDCELVLQVDQRLSIQVLGLCSVTARSTCSIWSHHNDTSLDFSVYSSTVYFSPLIQMTPALRLFLLLLLT